MAEAAPTAEQALPKNEVVVVGGGLVGCLCAVLLQRSKRFKVTIYERYSDMRNIPSLGRSINLVMTRRGLKAAELLQIKEELCALSVKVLGRSMWLQKSVLPENSNSSAPEDTSSAPEDGKPKAEITHTQVFQKYGREEDCNYSVSRYELNCFLLREAERLGVTVNFGHRLKKADFTTDEGKTTLVFEVDVAKNGTSEDLRQETAADAKAPTTTTELKTVNLGANVPVFGCDGGPSGVRYSLKEQGFLTFTEEILGQSYREIMFPKAKAGGYCMEASALHIWPRRTHMLMGLADRGGTFTGTLYVDNDAWPKTKEEAEKFFDENYSTAVPLAGGMDSCCEQLLQKPPGLLGTVRTSKFNLDGRCVLVGDSAHAIVPFFGQGCNCGFEDCVILDQIMQEKLPAEADAEITFKDWQKIFEAFHEQRKPSADAIANLALENFVEMRELVGDIQFLKAKHVEKTLEMKIPEQFRSRYSLVCYGSATRGNLTYANAYALGTTIKEVIGEIVDKVEAEQGSAYVYDGEPPETQTALVLKYGEPLVQEKVKPRLVQLGMDLSQIYA
ncbi:unnamed protein product [Amoebophrya sp. A25]|nr:unnamed protein product [Amoebophrya sp. A25]|eukprot:GSA25T00011044001.1